MAKKGQPNYDFDERLTCFTYFVHGKSLEQIAKERPPSLATLKSWSRAEFWSARKAAIEERALNQIHTELTRQKVEFVRDAWVTIGTLLQHVTDPHRIDKAKVNELTTAIGTLIDKAALVQQGGIPGGWSDEDFDDETIAEAEEIASSWQGEN